MRVIQLIVVFLSANLLIGLASSARRLPGSPATPEEALSVRGACILPWYGTQSACCYPHLLWGAGWDVATNYREEFPGSPSENVPCTCSGSYVGFGEGMCDNPGS